MTHSRTLLAALICMTGMLYSHAYDLTVTLRLKETGQKLPEMNVGAATMDYGLIEFAVYNAADTTYFLKGLPDNSLYVIYEREKDDFGVYQIPQPVDTVTVPVPFAELSHARQLEEVEVFAASNYMTGEKSVFTPTRQQKKVSADGSMLLFNLAIPEVKVSLADGAVTNQNGEGYSIYVDYVKASPDMLKNVKTSDVVKVEVYENPGDPRFQGDRNVINFIMVKYEYGGYAKLTANEWLIYNNGNYNAYAKGTYKKMTYEAGGNFNWSGNNKSSAMTETEFGFPDHSVDRSKERRDSINKSHGGSGFFRAIHQSKKSTVSNIVGFSAQRVPGGISINSELFNAPGYESGRSVTTSSSRSNSVTWNGEYQFMLPRDLTLIVTPAASYMASRGFSGYAAEEINVRTDTKEDAWTASVSGRLTKKKGQNSFTLSLHQSLAGNDMDYFGSSPYSIDSKTSFTSLYGNASLSLGHVYIRPSVRLGYQHETLGDKKRDNFDPHFNLYTNWMIRNNSRLSFSADLGRMFVPLSSLSPTVQFSDQISGYMGNDGLKPCDLETLMLNWTWTPIEQIWILPSASFQRYGNMYDNEYFPMVFEGRDYMIRRTLNGGHCSTLTYGLNAGTQLLKRTLSISASVNGNTYDVDGTMLYRKTNWTGSLQASYMYRNAYVSASCNTPQTTASQFGIYRSPAAGMISIGWGNGTWNLSATASNPFRSSYKGMKASYFSKPYTSARQDYGASNHRWFSLRAVYTFSYGKKVQQGNESQAPESSVQSGILK